MYLYVKIVNNTKFIFLQCASIIFMPIDQLICLLVNVFKLEWILYVKNTF